MQPQPTATAFKNFVLMGVVLMLLGDFLFALNDAMGKWLVTNFSVGQVLLIRSLGSFIILGPLIARQGPAQLVKVELKGLQVLRVLLATLDVGLFYAAVAYLPLADVMTFYMAGPIYVAALSHFFLNERIGWRRWLAVFVGFCGVVIALRPSSAMLSLPSLFGIVGSLSFAVALVLNRYLRNTSDTTLVTWQMIAALLVGAVLSIGTWQPTTQVELGGMLALGVVASCAHLLITRSLKLAPASLLAPLQYSLLIWAIALGYLFFGDVPDLYVITGATIIVIAGLFIFHRKNLLETVPPEAVAPDGH
ncbi:MULTISPECIES: DMT family transporter [unclassified Rhizobium]|uniref:DMT family transporter n=1 Tax=unclassified Rhizobium TaxID=2613769 RepID=UPI00104A8392|nr:MULTISPECIES: DMT family transporter [unclassified Rhizobium]MBB3393538.1 S-adenosylmethionine uptake transporter [Rhizobium sp. BK060]MBB4166254.1 S-adenosylmethionine uptake transporter [Rhizobium sp. BK538]TCM81856.1 S-adenosylmethionine uptake transporter [Rhizobium sp. BK068]